MVTKGGALAAWHCPPRLLAVLSHQLAASSGPVRRAFRMYIEDAAANLKPAGVSPEGPAWGPASLLP